MSGAIAVTTAVAAVGIAVAGDFAIFATVAAVGAVVGAVGAVTHVKELQYAGAAIGAVGLVGGIASSLGAFGEGGLLGGGLFGGGTSGAASGAAGGGDFASVMGQSEAGLGSSLSGASNAIDAGLNAGSATANAVMQGGAPVDEGLGGIIDSINGLKMPTAMAPIPDTAAAPSVTPAATDGGSWSAAATTDPLAAPANPNGPTVQVTGLTEPPNVPQVGQPATAANPADLPTASEKILDSTGPSISGNRSPAGVDVTATAPPSGQVSISGSGVTGQPAPSGIAGVGNSLGGQTASIVAATTSASPWDAIGRFVNKNPLLMFGAMQTAGKFMEGAFGNSLSGAQMAELEARAEQNRSAASYYDAQSTLLNRRVANLSQPLPAANRTPMVRPAGLINSQYATGGVTGQVA